MLSRHRPWWILAAGLWTGMILFSSFPLAERFCDRALDRLVTWVMGPAAGDDHQPPDRFWPKKTAHVFLFGVLAFLLAHVIHGEQKHALLRIVLIGVAVGCSSEALQLLFPTREPTLRDAAINAGSTLAGGAWFLNRSKRGRVSL